MRSKTAGKEEATPVPVRKSARAKIVAPAVDDAVPPVGHPAEITAGPWVQTTEEIFPIAWMAMLFAVCYIGVYFAVEALPGPNWLPGPGWFT